MKNNKFLLGILITLLVWGILIFIIINIPKIGAKKLNILELDVEGMVCPNCASAIELSLISKDSIAEATFDYKKGVGTIVYYPTKISKEEILNLGILTDFYQASIVSDKTFKGKLEEKLIDYPIEISEGVNKLKESSATLQLILSAKAKGKTELSEDLKQDYIEILDSLKPYHNNLNDEDVKREFRKQVLGETSEQIYLLKQDLPGDFTYDLKKKAEQIQIELAVNPVLKTKSNFLAGNSRLIEAEILIDEGRNVNDESIVSLLDEYKESIDNSINLIKITEKKGETKKQLLDFVVSVKHEITDQIPKQNIILEKIYGKIPQDILDSLDQLLKISSQGTNIFQIKSEEIPTFLNLDFVKEWYSHTIFKVDEENKLIMIRDGKNHEFPIDFGFAELHLREHHGVGSYIDEMGLVDFLKFAMENNLYQHKMDKVVTEDNIVMIKGDEGTDFETTFEMTFENIMKHMRLDHKWTNQELLDAGYCQDAFEGLEVNSCVNRLTKYS